MLNGSNPQLIPFAYVAFHIFRCPLHLASLQHVIGPVLREMDWTLRFKLRNFSSVISRERTLFPQSHQIQSSIARVKRLPSRMAYQSGAGPTKLNFTAVRLQPRCNTVDGV